MHRGGVAPGLDVPEARDLFVAHARGNIQNVYRGFFFDFVFVHTDDGVFSLIDAGLPPGGRLLDAHLGHAGFNGAGHAAQLLDFVHDFFRFADNGRRQRLHVVGAAQRIDHAADLRFLLNDDLRVAGNARRQRRGEAYRLVERIGVQRLRAAQRRGQRLQRGPDDIVVGVLLGQAPAGRLHVRAQNLRSRIGRMKFSDNLMPQIPSSAQHGDFHEKVHAHPKEKRKPRSEIINLQAAVDGGADILLAVGQRKSRLEHRIRARFHDVIAADRNGVVARHVFRAVGDDVGNDPHGGPRRIDVGVARQKFLEDVILNGAGELLLRYALLLGGHDVSRQDRQDGAVHRHGNGHLVERNPVEKDFHVLDGIDGNPRLPHVSRHTRMVGVVAPMSRQIKSDGQARLPRGQILPVKCIGFLGRGESRVLADRPGLVGVHGGRRPPQIRSEAGQGVDGVQPRQVFRGVDRLDDNALRRRPVQRLQGPSLQLPEGGFFPLFHVLVHGHVQLLR